MDARMSHWLGMAVELLKKLNGMKNYFGESKKR